MDHTTAQSAAEIEYSISDLATEFAITPRTLRWYETEGLLNPERRSSHRVYTGRDRTRLRLILRGKRIGLSLAEISEIIDMYAAPPGEAGQLRHLIVRIGERRTELRSRLNDIERTLGELDAVEQRAQERLDEIGSAD